LHLNTLGHTRLAAAVGHALDLPGNDPQWMIPLALQRRPAAWRRAVGEAHWVASFVGPWLLRRLRGRSSGDGRTAKRPALAPVEENL
jgi:hypothetical protein